MGFEREEWEWGCMIMIRVLVVVKGDNSGDVNGDDKVRVMRNSDNDMSSSSEDNYYNNEKRKGMR